MKHLLLILNPAAGMKKASKALSDIIAVFNRAQYDTHVYVTACQGDAIKAVQRWGSKMDLIVCAGGDGTLNETVTGLIDTGLQVPLGYIPAGSTNDFASSLHLSGNVVEAAKQIVNGTSHSYDVGKFGDRYFAYVASFGAFTKASYSTPQNVKNALGHLAYILEGIQELSTLRKAHIQIQLENKVLEDDYLFGAICNSTSIGGVLTLDPSLVDMGDGQFELLLLRAPRDIMELHECVVALQTQKYNCRMLTFLSTNALTVTATPAIPWSLDGEKADKVDTIYIENLHQKIRLVH
ncbi:MAG: YegS/Rv2252/BmrU family lipid kinase [Firmicutes bacterium]|nr:YegS/Rv2252/BmrU family lipid kinase [Bacillota bacterium]